MGFLVEVSSRNARPKAMEKFQSPGLQIKREVIPQVDQKRSAHHGKESLLQKDAGQTPDVNQENWQEGR